MRYRLFLDDDRWPAGKPDHWELWEWVVARNFDDAAWYVQNYGLPYHIAFDHDLGAKKMTGMDFAIWFTEFVMENKLALPKDFSFWIHSINPVGARNIQNRMDWFLEHHEPNQEGSRSSMDQSA